jgi:hypothetical protein
MSSAHDISSTLETGTYMLAGLAMAGLASGVQRVRDDRAEAAAADARNGAAVFRGASRAHAADATDLRIRLIGAESEISRLRRLVDDLQGERSDLIQAAGLLMQDNDRLHAARIH